MHGRRRGWETCVEEEGRKETEERGRKQSRREGGKTIPGEDENGKPMLNMMEEDGNVEEEDKEP